MNRCYKFPCGKKNALVLWLLAAIWSVGYAAHAQSPSIFTAVDTTVVHLNSAQRAIYNKATDFGSYNAYQFVHVESMAAKHQDSLLTMSLSGMDDTSVQYETNALEYTGDTSFYWYGKIYRPDSTTSAFYKGEAMIFTYGGQYYGYLIANDKNFELIDLSGGIQLLAQVDSAFVANGVCGTQPGPGTAKMTAPEPTGGYQCSPRIFVLFTWDALVSDPMGFARATLAFNQTKQAVRNSDVSPFRMNLQFAGVGITEYTESVFNLADPSHTGLTKDLSNMYDPASTLSSDVNFWQTGIHPDMIILLRKISYFETTIGLSYQADPPTFNSPYAVVQILSATTAGYTFAHEVGHLMGARHGDDPADPMDADTNPSIAHAQRWFYSTSTHLGPITYNHDNWGHTITYQNTAGIGDVILQYSNPNLTSNGQVTGVTGDRDAAQEFRYVGCLVANYDSYPDEFTVAIGPDDRPKANNGNSIYCYGHTYTFASYITGPVGTYTYYWEVSFNGGVSYIPVTGGNTGSISQSFYAIGNFYYRLTVTAPGGSPSKVVYYPITVISCPFGITKTRPGIEITNLISVSPNPAGENIKVSYSLAKDGDADIKLYDISGKLVKVLHEGNMQQGEHEVITNISDIASGLYQIRFSASGFSKVAKVVIQH